MYASKAQLDPKIYPLELLEAKQIMRKYNKRQPTHPSHWHLIDSDEAENWDYVENFPNRNYHVIPNAKPVQSFQKSGTQPAFAMTYQPLYVTNAPLQTPNIVYTIPAAQPVGYYQYPSYPVQISQRSVPTVGSKLNHGPKQVQKPRTPFVGDERTRFYNPPSTAPNLRNSNSVSGISNTKAPSLDKKLHPIRFYHKSGREHDSLLDSSDYVIAGHDLRARSRGNFQSNGRLLLALNKVNRAAQDLQKISVDLNQNMHSMINPTEFAY